MNNTEFTAPWLIFQVCGGHYAINSGNVTSIIKTPEKISPVPGAPEVFRGIFELRGSVYPVLDMRILFHFKALEKEHSEFMQRADSRKAQLQEWAEKLRGCIEEKNIPSDIIAPESFAFGKWFEEYRGTKEYTDYGMNKADVPYTQLIENVQSIAEALKSSRSGVIDSLVNTIYEEFIPQIDEALEGAKYKHRSSFRETMILINKEEQNVAIAVDRVVAVDRIDIVDSKVKLNHIFDSGCFMGVARNSRVEENILLINEDALLDKAAREIPKQ